MEFLDGKKLRTEILAKIKSEVTLLSFQPIFCDILVGNDPSSAQYVKMKAKTAGGIGFPTALACMALLDSLNLNLKGKILVVLGQGELVGRPTAALLRYRGLTYLNISSKTENKAYLLRQADIVISGMGKGKHITGNMIKDGAVIIDAGTSESEGGIVGDVDLESVKNIASHVSPVPGGVGPVTVAMLLNNVLNVAKKLKQ